MATADVIIKIDVRDGEAKAKLTALEARLNRLNKAGNGASGSVGDLGDELDRTTSSTEKFNTELDKNERSHRKSGRASKGALKELRSLSNAFSPLIKFAKYAGIEFGVMAIAMVGLKVALASGQAVAKGWQFLLQGLGASAGLAIGALAGVLAAIRELNNAKLKPLALTAGATAGGGKGFGAEVSGLTGSGQLGMFKQQTLSGMAKSQYSAGNRVTADYRAMSESLGNFAITADDPDKALSSLTDTFAKAQKEGKFTEEMIKSISESSPHLGKALKETGMNADQFLAAFSKGEIESLKPFQGALDEVNNTLIGRFKTGLRETQEQLTEMGAGLTDTAKGPLSTFTRQISIFLTKITPTVRSVMSNLFPDDAMSGTQRFFDYLARSINTNLPKIFEWAKSLKDAFSGVGNIFGGVGDWLEKATEGFNNLYENMLKPIGVEIWKTIEHAIMAFADVMGSTEGYGEKFSETIANIGDGLRGFIDGLAELKKVMAPIVSIFMTMIGLVAKLAGALGPLKILLPLLALGALTGRSKVMGPGGVPTKMGMGGGILNTLSMGGYSRSLRGGMPADPNDPRAIRRQQRQEKYLGPAREAAATARARAETNMQYARGYGGQYGGYSGTTAHGIPLSDNQIKAKAGGPATIAGAKQFGKTLAQEAKKGLKGPGAMTGMSTAAMLAGGLIQGNTDSTSAVGQGIGGALGMAGAGAGIGFMVGGPVGAGIGAGIGAVAGGAMGIIGANAAQDKKDKEAKQRGADFARTGLDMNNPAAIQARITSLGNLKGTTKGLLENQLTGAAANAQIAVRDSGQTTFEKNGESMYQFAAYAGKDLKNREKALKEIDDLLTGENGMRKVTDPKAVTALNKYKNSIDALATAQEEFPKGIDKGIEGITGEIPKLQKEAATAGSNIDYLSKWMGKSKDEAKKFADQLGLNLSDKMLGLTDVIKLLGYEVENLGDKSVQTANRAQAAGRILETVMKPIEDRKKTAETNERLDAAGMQLFNYTGSDPGAAQKYADEFTGASFEKLTQEYQTNGKSFTQFLTDAQARRDNSVTQAEAGGMNPVALAAFKTSMDEALANLTTGAASVQGRMAMDPTYAIETAMKIQAATANVKSGQSVEEVSAALSTALSTDGITVDAAGATKLINDELGSTANKIASAIASTPITINGKIDIMVGSDSGTQVTGIDFTGSSGVTPPADDGDTSTSRLGRTLGKHMAFNSMVSGRRTVTSALRNTNLGSGMSDHKFGNAYDLTGDNLGQYASLVNGSGGFAEFHGAAGGRHLHVVPPSGDSSSPAMVGGGSGSTVNNYNISVQGGPNADAGEVARQVVTIIQQEQRSNRERS